MKLITATIALCAISSGSGFASLSTQQQRSSSALHMNDNQNGMKKAAAAFAAAAMIASNVVAVDPVMAIDDGGMDSLFGSSSQIVIAGRSGGRAGGRSSASRMRSSPSRAPTRVIQRTTVVRPSSPSVIVAPPVYGGGYGYGYNPMGGLGLSMGLNAVNQIGNDMRDYRQEGEIRDTRSQLQQSQTREAELEARLRVLENNQNMTPQQMQMMQQQMMMQQQAATAAAQK